jgi:zinc transport system substrate-binding protein
MKRYLTLFVIVLFISCNPDNSGTDKDIISVSIAPFKYFVREIAGEDFEVNIIVPPGANPHIYEPYPGQINNLRKSSAYISNGFMGFEDAWLVRFYEMNKNMVRLSLGESIDPISTGHNNESGHDERFDPHFWVSPKCALKIASSVHDLLCSLNPEEKNRYESNYNILRSRIMEADSLAESLFSGLTNRSFMIYHPNLEYLARDYGLKEIAVEFEGKEPPPSRFKELVDIAREEDINTIFIQKEYDRRNANAIAGEIGAGITVIDPLSEDWLEAVVEIITGLHKSLTGN